VLVSHRKRARHATGVRVTCAFVGRTLEDVVVNETIRRWVALLGFLAAAALMLAASYAAVAVRYCPTSGSCGWSPWLGLPAALVAVLALVACLRLAGWSQHGGGGSRAAMAMAAASCAATLCIAGYLLAIGAS
jgi:hypothetical protein